METPKVKDVKKGISLLWETLQCPICLDLMTAPVSTKCDHQFCKFCMMKLLANTKQNKANCPVCKAKITKRSLQESPGFQRLVTGLKGMILAYENDTGTNYLTGMQQQKEQSEVTDMEAGKHEMSLGDSPGTDPDSKDVSSDLPKSHSSTIAAQNGFARLMGLEDTSPLTAENSGLDSGLGEAPPTFNKIIHSPTNFEDTEMLEKSPTCKKVKTGTSKLEEDVPDGTKQQPLRMSLRKRNKRDLEPDGILNQKQKKSLEKVAEWLMKVPSDGQLEKPNEDADDSDSCSSNSTIDIGEQNNCVNLTREDPVKTLEDQVFGAIYRRERRGNRITSPPPNVIGKPVKAKTIELDTLSPADFVKKTTFEDKSANDMEQEPQIIKEPTNLPENDKNDFSIEVPCPVSDVGQQPAENKQKKRKQITQRQVDSDLLDQAKAKSETTDQTQNNKKRSKITVSEKSKPAKGTKPLILVTVENGETSPKTRLRPEEVKVHIENYPSSEDQEVPVAKRARRGRRLKVFTEEVQGCQKKLRSKASIPEKGCNVSNQCADSEGEILDNSRSPKNENTTKRTERNGCIYHQDLGGVEIESGEKASSRPENDPKNSTSELPNAEILSEVTAVQNSTSPTKIALKEPTLEGDNPNSNTQDCAAVGTECTWIRNEEDSEQDTEQLVRSFKATKRRSFHLGGAQNTKKICRSDQENVECTAAEENQYVCSSVAEEQKHTTIPEINHEALSNSENKSCDLIPPSNSPNLTRKAVVEKPHQVVVEALIPDSCSGQEDFVANPVLLNSASSPLTPNKVSKHKLESPCLSFIPKLGESGLFFTDAECNETNITSKFSQITENQTDCAAREEIGDSISMRSSRGNPSANVAEQILNAESLTPDGLVMPLTQTVHEAKSSTHGSGDLSTHSSIKGMVRKRKRKRKRAKRLESSSDLSDCTGEELPTLNEILGMAAPPSSVSKNLRHSSDANRCDRVTAVRGDPLSRPAACPSPDCVYSSQASMDLFGTPDECTAAVNDPSVSVESSQFSSEVLVTQQKIEMQKELVRLEKLMALVSEVLQEKEASPKTDQNRQITDTHRPLLHGQDTASDGKTVPEAECEANIRPSDNGGITQHTMSKHSSIAEIAQCSTHTVASVKDTGVSKTLSSNSAVKMLKSNGSPSDGQEDKENNTPTRDRSKIKMVLVSSGLGPNEQITVKKFARRVGARVVSQVTPEVTHVIMNTDEQLVCERTLKYFLGIAGRKWMMSFQWISECFKQKKLLNESSFEVKGDVVNGSNHQGPMRARKTEDDNLLLKDFKICFQGPFTDMTTEEMEWMVELCGAAVFKDPLLLESKQKSQQLVIVQPGSESTSAYSSLSRRATVVTRGWLLDTVSTYTIQNFSKYAAETRVP